jgi:plastocyanin
LTIANATFSEASGVAGQAFSIVNSDGVAHTVTDDGKAFDLDLLAGGTASLTVISAGTYKIHCKIHSSMHGTIVVA